MVLKLQVKNKVAILPLFMKNIMRLAITMGDPGGIGPEIALKAICRSSWPDPARFILIGDANTWGRCARKLKLPRPCECKNIGETDNNKVSVWDPEASSSAISAGAKTARKNWRAGRTGKSEGAASLLWIRAAAAGCLAGAFDGMVTSPICKSSIQAAGCGFPGHTEYLAHLASARKVGMMLMGGPLRVILATRHVPIKLVPRMLTRGALIEAIEMASLAVKWLGLPQKPIGVCGLNPHAGDNGMLGAEEKTIIAPVIGQLRKRGLEIDGIIPGDVIFHQALENKFGAIVAMYHDQGLGPLKMLFFDRGVNLTLGLPFVRTSPDHGTAFDIAGKGIASSESMAEAIKLAIKLARRPNPWKQA